MWGNHDMLNVRNGRTSHTCLVAGALRGHAWITYDGAPDVYVSQGHKYVRMSVNFGSGVNEGFHIG